MERVEREEREGGKMEWRERVEWGMGGGVGREGGEASGLLRYTAQQAQHNTHTHRLT